MCSASGSKASRVYMGRPPERGGLGTRGGDGLADEIGGGSPGVEKARFRGLFHAREIELDAASEACGHGENREGGLGGVEERLLRFLQVFVVGERQAFYRDHEGIG